MMRLLALLSVLVLGPLARAEAQACAFTCDSWNRLLVSGLPAPDPANFTVEAWVRPLRGTGADQYVLRRGSAWSLRWRPDTAAGSEGTFAAVLNVVGTNGAIINLESGPLEKDRWYHVALRWTASSGTARLDIDGVRVDRQGGLQGGTLDQESGALSVGAQAAGNALFEGGLDELRIWSTARDPDALSWGRTTDLRRAEGLTAAWSFDETLQSSSASVTFTRPDADPNHPPRFEPGRICGRNRLYAGTRSELELQSGIGGRLDTGGLEPVREGDTLSIQITAPQGNLAAYTTLWVLQARPSLPNAPSESLPGIWIDPNLPYETIDISGVGRNGIALSFAIPALESVELWAQAITLVSWDPSGFIASDAHRIALPTPVHVSAQHGSSQANGTSIDPVDTIAAGYAIATSYGSADLFISAGSYTENLLFDQRVSVYGGYSYNPSTGTWAAPTHPGSNSSSRSLILSDQRGLRISDVRDGITLSGIRVEADRGVRSSDPNAQNMNLASVALDMRRCSEDVLVTGCQFLASNGADGYDGANGANDAQGGSGGRNGEDGRVTARGVSPDGGRGATGGGFAGGAGGDGGAAYNTTQVASAEDGQRGRDGVGCNNGGAGGSRSGCGTAGHGRDGDNGDNGRAGSNGAPAGQVGGALSEGSWLPGSSTGGERGEHGCGGGGGGGGGGVICVALGTWFSGGGGGGGGSGGQGGRGGRAGTEGAPSIAAWIFDSSPHFEDCLFVAGRGGDGGRGGNGRDGASGGSGGGGGNDRGVTIANQGIRSGEGGSGGRGGRGGHGGGGGGAHGGDSWCVLKLGSSAPSGLDAPSSNVFTLGIAGSGGSGGNGNGGSAGGDGQSGRRGAVGNF